MNHKSKLCREHCPKKSNKERVDCRVKDDACGWYTKTELAFVRGEYKIGDRNGLRKHVEEFKKAFKTWLALH